MKLARSERNIGDKIDSEEGEVKVIVNRTIGLTQWLQRYSLIAVGWKVGVLLALVAFVLHFHLLDDSFVSLDPTWSFGA